MSCPDREAEQQSVLYWKKNTGILKTNACGWAILPAAVNGTKECFPMTQT